MLTDFRKAPTVIPDLFIDAIQVELGQLSTSVLDNKLNLTKTLTLFTNDVSQEYFAFKS